MLNVELYHRYLRGKLSEDELASFKEDVGYVSDDDLWQMMEAENSLVDDINVKITEEQREEILNNLHRKIKKHPFGTFLKYAAAMLFAVVSVTFYQLFYHSSDKCPLAMSEVVSVPGNKAKIVLPDGTKVEINSATVMRYAVEKHGRREVIIKSGEAYFDVAKDYDHPFHISVNNMHIEVLGTTFNINAYGPQISTSLFSGSIRLTGTGLKKAYMLKPGEKSIYETTSHQLSIGQNNKDEDLGWKNGYLIFNSTPLCEVITKIERWYGVRIKLENSQYADDKLTGSFHNETLESVLNSLSMQYKFKYQNQKGVIIVK